MSSAKIWLDENGIIREVHSEPMVTLEVANHAIQERARIAGDEKKRVLVKFDRIFGFTEETQHLNLDVMLKNISALAFCVQGKEEISLMQKMLIQRFYETTPYPVPVKVFYDEKSAIEWLMQYMRR